MMNQKQAEIYFRKALALEIAQRDGFEREYIQKHDRILWELENILSEIPEKSDQLHEFDIFADIAFYIVHAQKEFEIYNDGKISMIIEFARKWCKDFSNYTGFVARDFLISIGLC